MKRMLSRKLWAVAVVGLLVASGCGGQSAESQQEPFDEAKASQEVTAAVEVWLPDSADEVSEQLGMWVALGGAPVSGDIAADAVRSGLLGELEVAVEHVELAKGTDSYSGTVSVSFPITVKLTVGRVVDGSDIDPGVLKEYLVTALFDVTVTDGRVVAASQGCDVHAEAVKE